MSQGRLLLWKRHWKQLGLGGTSWVRQCLKESSVILCANSITQVKEELRFGPCLHLLARWRKESTKKQWCLTELPSPERATLTLQTSP